MAASHLRCFWRWPLGHRWEVVSEQEYAVKRCRECGKKTPVSKWEKPPPSGSQTWGY